MAAFTGDSPTVPVASQEASVHLAGETVTDGTTPTEGAVHLAGESPTTPFWSIIPTLQPSVTTDEEQWTTNTVTVPVDVQPTVPVAAETWGSSSGTPGLLVQPVVPTAEEAWSTAALSPQVLPGLGEAGETWGSATPAATVSPAVLPAGEVWTGEAPSPVVEPVAASSGESWGTSVVVVPGGTVAPTVTPAEETWTTSPLTVRIIPNRPAQVFAAGPGDGIYVDILRQGERVPERKPDNVYAFRPRAPRALSFEHAPVERKLMVAGTAYAPATVNLWSVALTALFFGSVVFALRRRR